MPGGGVGFFPGRSGRKSKLLDDSAKEGVRATKLARGRTDVTALLADLRQKLAEVQSENFDEDVVEKQRAPKENKSKFNIEQHNFSLEEDERSTGVAVPSGNQQQQFYTQQQQQQYYQQQQFNQQKFSQAQPNVAARQFVQGRGESAPLFNQFGDAMGPDASTDPEANNYPTQPQLNPRQQDGEEDVRCIKKVMQVEETVYEEIGKHTSELQSRSDLVCRLLLEKKKKKK